MAVLEHSAAGHRLYLTVRQASVKGDLGLHWVRATSFSACKAGAHSCQPLTWLNIKAVLGRGICHHHVAACSKGDLSMPSVSTKLLQDSI